MSKNANDDRREEQPLYSRLFVVCSRLTKEEDLKKFFGEYGTVEDLFMPRNRTTGERRGVAYIKYSKTSSAAAAIKNLHMKNVGNGTIKVMVAASKNEPDTTDQYGDKYTRLFIKIAKDAQEHELKEHFSQFGNVQSVYKIKDKTTGDYKGFAYIKFTEFYDAAKAFEECDQVYKPIFAKPKDLKRTRSKFDHELSHSMPQHRSMDSFNCSPSPYFEPQKNDITSLIKSEKQDFKDVLVTCSPILPEKYIYQLMNIAPGMVKCIYSVDTYNGLCKARVSYEDSRSALYAVEKLHKYEFPSGEIISVKPGANPLAKVATDLSEILKNFKNSADSGTELIHLAEAIEKASSLLKAAVNGDTESQAEVNVSYCNVPLPPPQPKSTSTRVMQRLFIVCKPQPPPLDLLQDAFIRFGDFMSITTFPNKTYGFVCYASTSAAQDAKRVLHDAMICGMRLRVLEADEKPHADESTDNNKVDYQDIDSKRMKFE